MPLARLPSATYLVFLSSLASGMVRASAWQVSQQPLKLARGTLLSSNMTASLTALSLSIFSLPLAGGCFQLKRR